MRHSVQVLFGSHDISDVFLVLFYIAEGKRSRRWAGLACELGAYTLQTDITRGKDTVHADRVRPDEAGLGAGATL